MHKLFQGLPDISYTVPEETVEKEIEKPKCCIGPRKIESLAHLRKKE